MWFSIVALLQCSVLVLGYTKPEKKCGSEDYDCIANIVKDMFQSALKGNEKDLDFSVDPLHQELVEGNIHDVKYRLVDSTVKGFKDAVIQKVTFPVPHEVLQLDIILPYYEMFGNYKIEGKLLKLDINGEGKYYVNASNVHVIIDTKKNFIEKDGKHYLKLTYTETKAELVGNIHLDLENLFNGNKELADPILQFINENTKQVAGLWQRPIAAANMEKMLVNFNKILAGLPLEDIIDKPNFKP